MRKKEPQLRRIFIHKNYLKHYWKIRRWCDVPEFCEFMEVPAGWVQIVEKK